MITFCHYCNSWENVFWCEECPDWECAKCRCGVSSRKLMKFEDFYDTSLIWDPIIQPDAIDAYCHKCNNKFILTTEKTEIKQTIFLYHGFGGESIVVDIVCPMCGFTESHY